MNLSNLYRPITATPFAENDRYVEIEPCDSLKPYIRCFWGTKRPYIYQKEEMTQSIVVPDTCMDVIFSVDYTENKINGSFCGIDESAFTTDEERKKGRCTSTFGIRFYAWTAVLFSEESMKDVKNAFFDAGHHFSRLKSQLEPVLFDIFDIRERVETAEQYLLEHLHLERENALVQGSVYEIVKRQGNLKAGELGKLLHISNRQIERLFKENVGISPKKLSSLVRYQYLWNHAVYRRNFNIQDEVYQLGYADQAHLMNDFRRFHTMSIQEARKNAWKDVVFLQEKNLQ